MELAESRAPMEYVCEWRESDALGPQRVEHHHLARKRGVDTGCESGNGHLDSVRLWDDSDRCCANAVLVHAIHLYRTARCAGDSSLAPATYSEIDSASLTCFATF